ncbi:MULTISPECIES: DNA gyrase inhibitor YacG [Gammaproteobacteria]|uniref:DNA gyrase inhibitor YacG n=1 Tax=Gammaproteobacteria TaxID=1236 RepID=UPI000DD00F2F|nr:MULTISPECIES: DNA gyrase inhibitor YacG [Gammaproteobacteria]RTE86309.1 DNA gyrase inhibitor YacG [Aliidiomarina sp. B3213]TCZ91659.1 DNA gyrase inhibitor YacG [Lysobacter sp. N42]
MPNTTTVQCPTCDTKVKWTSEAKYRPFCSERCKLIDLGEWASEEKRIPGEELPPSANESDSSVDGF